ncbi:MAG: cytochrome c peroxidase, partial [Gammaproteobacteria bacterium]
HDPVELGFDQVMPERLAELNGDAHVAQQQRAAFGELNAALDLDQVVKALATYVRTLVAADSAFDRYLYWGETLPSSAQRGMGLFFSQRLSCALCHASFNLSGPIRQQDMPAVEAVFHNTGLYNLGGSGAYPDVGAMAHTNQRTDMGAFRAPTLRNVAVTAPYMHDGSVPTLADVVDFYAAGGRNIESGPEAGDGRLNPFKRKDIHELDLTAQEKSDLVAFLESLTDARYKAE